MIVTAIAKRAKMMTNKSTPGKTTGDIITSRSQHLNRLAEIAHLLELFRSVHQAQEKQRRREQGGSREPLPGDFGYKLGETADSVRWAIEELSG